MGRTAALGDAALEQALSPAHGAAAAPERRTASTGPSSGLSLAEVGPFYCLGS